MAKYRVIRNRKAYLRRRSIRRFLSLAIIVAIFAYLMYSTYLNRMQRLEEIKGELAIYQEIHEEVLLRQGFYNNQIVRLKDEDYIAMLAREHLRSLPNEIVFRIIGDETEFPDEDLSGIMDNGLSEDNNLSEDENSSENE